MTTTYQNTFSPIVISKLPTKKSLNYLIEKEKDKLDKYTHGKLMRMFAVEYINKYEMRNPTIFEAQYIRQNITKIILETSNIADLTTDIHGEDDILLQNLTELLILANSTLEIYEKRYFKYDTSREDQQQDI